MGKLKGSLSKEESATPIPNQSNNLVRDHNHNNECEFLDFGGSVSCELIYCKL